MRGPREIAPGAIRRAADNGRRVNDPRYAVVNDLKAETRCSRERYQKDHKQTFALPQDEPIDALFHGLT